MPTFIRLEFAEKWSEDVVRQFMALEKKRWKERYGFELTYWESLAK